MNEPTLADAERMIERTKACRDTCRDTCDIVSYDLELTILSGSAPQLPDLRRELGEVVLRHLGPGWIHAPHAPGFLRRCERCANKPLYPWADRLKPEKVLEFMVLPVVNGHVFALSDLRVTL